MVGQKELEKRERGRSKPKRGAIVSQPIEEREENTGKCTKKNNKKNKKST